MSNVHVAKDRAWFTDYTPFKTELRDAYGMMKTPTPVVGIGTVDLATKCLPNQTGPGSRAVLHLKNVLHTPSAICNILGGPLFNDYDVTTGGEANSASSGSIKDSEGRCVAYFDRRKSWFQVRPCGPPYGPQLGPTVFKEGGAYMLSVSWPASEQKRWHDHQNKAVAVLENPGYTSEEKAWLKKHYKSEFHFLRVNGLKIYKNEDRGEGRLIVRAMMRTKEEDVDEDGRPRKRVRM
ncbi:hypothetical protein EMCG_07682 [[Emmonsia] crescens]|uniref:Uncharacterized protein n=1 Tax=[Emmonsia] crescens TaxID=73230 RepID=A0A0G2I7T7_9EURO|nr:hypothetical protein EMCG_07682 [Emmonsia crescens UAMH 3008]